MRSLRAAIFAALSFSVSELADALRKPERPQRVERSESERLEEEESPWDQKLTFQERKERARERAREQRLQEQRMREAEQEKLAQQHSELVALSRGPDEENAPNDKDGPNYKDYQPPKGYTPLADLQDYNGTLSPTVFFAKPPYPPGTVIDDIKSGAIIGAIVGLTYQDYKRMHFPAADKILYGLKDTAWGTALGALIGMEVGRSRGKPLGFNLTTGDHNQRHVAKGVTVGGLIGLGVGWMAAELYWLLARMEAPFTSPASKRARCQVHEDETVAKGWDLGAYVRKPWYAQSMMESWYQPLDSFPCTEARYITKPGFKAPEWGEPNPKEFEGKFMIDVRNIAPIKNKTILEQIPVVAQVVKGLVGDDTFGFLCARRMTKKHGLFVGPCMLSGPRLADVEEDPENWEVQPTPVNYWVLSYSETKFGGYAIIVAGQPDLTAPDGTCNFIDNDMKGMWILSRKRNLKASELVALKSHASSSLNLDTSEMIDVPNFNCPSI